MGRVDWEDLRYVLAVSREGTLLGAAKALRVSPTTVTRRLQSLEASLGSRLFEKIKHGAVLNDVGARVVSVAEQVERLTDELDAEIAGRDQKLAGVVRLTATEFVFRLWMRDFIGFRRRFPGIELELVSTTNVLNLTKREADVAVRLGMSAPEHLVGTHHATMAYGIYGCRRMLSEATSIAFSDLPWVAWDLGFSRSVDAWIDAHAPKADIVLRVGQMSLMVAALEAGHGISMLPCVIGDSRPGLQRLGDLLDEGPKLWVLTHPELRGSARVRALTGFLRELMRRDVDLFEGRHGAP